MGRAERHPRHHRRTVPDPLRPGADLTLPGAIPSPNIWQDPATYELENRAFDRAALVWDAVGPINGRALDIGCGTGFHLPHLAASARTVTGVEPHEGLLRLAARRCRSLPVTLLRGTAQALPLPPASVDFAHARLAYFFGPGCEPGLAELDRVMARGGRAVIIDNDASRSTFGAWFRRGYPSVDPGAVERFFTGHGFRRTPVLTAWTFDHREDLEAVVRIEFTRALAEEILAGHDGTAVDYAVNVWTRDY